MLADTLIFLFPKVKSLPIDFFIYVSSSPFQLPVYVQNFKKVLSYTAIPNYFYIKINIDTLVNWIIALTKDSYIFNELIN